MSGFRSSDFDVEEVAMVGKSSPGMVDDLER